MSSFKLGRLVSELLPCEQIGTSLHTAPQMGSRREASVVPGPRASRALGTEGGRSDTSPPGDGQPVEEKHVLILKL